MNLEDVKNYLKIDDDIVEEDEFLASLIIGSELYLKNAIGTSVDTLNPLFVLAQKMLISDWFENRGSLLVGKTSKTLENSLNSIITQLKVML